MRAGFWLLAVALVALAAGCGGSSSKSSQSTASTEAAATTRATTTTAPTLRSFATSKNCQQLLRLGETFANALQATSGSDATLADESKAFKAMADAAPEAIRAEFRTLAGAFADYAQAFKDAGIKAGAQPTAAQLGKVVKAAQAFATPDVKAAQERISTWAAANCGVKTTTTG
ncbi:MAG: hypothetical protein ACXVZL_10365 [Gaiellaceae bacterium]